MNNDIYKNAFYNNKNNEGSAYNYDLTPLIDNFSFYDFITYAHKNNLKDEDYGGFLVITQKQYIVGYNSSFGTGTHLSSFARTMQDLKGGGFISNLSDALYLTTECTDNYLTAVIVYENTLDNMNSKPIYRGYINFEVPDRISPKTYKVFEKFYEDFNEDIKYITNKYNTFEVIFNSKDQNGKKKIINSKDLELLKEYLNSIIDENKKDYEIDESLIGITPKTKAL